MMNLSAVFLLRVQDVLIGDLSQEEERERTTPIVAFDDGFMTQEIADTFPNSDL